LNVEVLLKKARFSDKLLNKTKSIVYWGVGTVLYASFKTFLDILKSSSADRKMDFSEKKT
jgi:hypothetical protein